MRFHRRTRSVLFASAVGAAAVIPGLNAQAVAAPTPSVENAGMERLADDFPECWEQYSTGKNAGEFRLAKGASGKNAVEVEITERTSGFKAAVQDKACAVKVKPGRQYDLELRYKSTSDSPEIVLFRKNGAGKWSRWETLPPFSASKSFRSATVRTPVVPEDTEEIRFGLALSEPGTLVTDNYRVAAASGELKCKGPECKRGKWVVRAFTGNKGVRAIHSVLLHNGKVLMIAGSGNGAGRFGRGEFVTKVYDPKTNKFTNVPTPYDMFCAGHVQLPDGRVLVMSGTEEYAQYDEVGNETAGWIGSKKSYIFNPKTNRYQKVNDMIDGHWYPSATILGNGDVYSVGGYAAQRADNAANLVSVVAERYSLKQKRWLPENQVAQPGINWATYPSLILTQDGKLFYNGSSVFSHPVNADGSLRGPGFLNPNTGAWGALPNNGNLRAPASRDMSAALLLPPAQDQKVMVIGGKNFATPTKAIRYTDVINLKAANPRFVAGPNIPYGQVEIGDQMVKQGGGAGKTYVSAVILADGKVFETGGSQFTRSEHVHEASILDPTKQAKNMKWTPVAADPVARTYHNTAVLLPDGRVLAAGSNPDYPGADGDSFFDTRISIYSPPYLYKGARPKITTAPKGWKYGSKPVIKTNSKITKAYLIRPIAVTHSSDPNQRLVNLPVKSLGGNKYRLTMDKRANIAPPGWYMLVVRTKGGQPSVAKWVHVS
ncbi:galactose oxidase early set domain-containing protein [Actinocorallia sp. A-T 12471]|uniref:galactose oxidase early set domain-containing protein n=1 Tax=Actinocorallia sp. A-T 12471 TaxID=3089813 RepID=UPI0029CE716F|nr:galactose oxidase early set domain-containing protein [Actinocorallia sp. A-T 12471]MDX6743533.1 galactose oxidase early set domain-containing protein [Actinocorallia sp. A-T 12471]